MNFICVICCEFINNYDLYLTKCGHLYHLPCIKTWFTNRMTCPQCRVKLSLDLVFKIYPTLASSTENVNPTELQHNLDNIKLQLNERDKTIKEVKCVNKSLKKELRDAKNELSQKTIAMTVYARKIDLLEEKGLECSKLKEENESLVKKLEILSGLQTIIDTSKEEVDAMMETQNDVRTIAIYLTAIKRMFEDFKEMNRSLKTQLQKVTDELSSSKAKFEALRNEMTSSNCENVETEPRPTTSAASAAEATSTGQKENPKETVFAMKSFKTGPSNSPYFALKHSSIPFSTLQPKSYSKIKRPNPFKTVPTSTTVGGRSTEKSIRRSTRCDSKQLDSAAEPLAKRSRDDNNTKSTLNFI